MDRSGVYNSFKFLLFSELHKSQLVVKLRINTGRVLMFIVYSALYLELPRGASSPSDPARCGPGTPTPRRPP